MDTSNTAQLELYVRGQGEAEFLENILLRKPLKGNVTARSMFKVTTIFLG